MNLLSLSLRAGPEESQAGKGLSEAMIRWLSVCGWLDFRISEPVSELSPDSVSFVEDRTKHVGSSRNWRGQH